MADAEVLVRNVRAWASDWGEGATLEVIDHVSDLEAAANYDLAFLGGVPNLLAGAWRVWIVEVQVQNGGYYQYFWNGYAPIAAVTADDLDAMNAPGVAAVQRAAIAAFGAAADQLNDLRSRPNSPYGQPGPYGDGLAIEDFSAQDDAWRHEYDRQPITALIGMWLAQRADAVADAVLATRHLPGAS